MIHEMLQWPLANWHPRAQLATEYVGTGRSRKLKACRRWREWYNCLCGWNSAGKARFRG